MNIYTETKGLPRSGSKALNIGLWVGQVLLLLAFGMAGFMKTFTPIAELAEKAEFARSAFGAILIRFIGISELAGAIGVILPAVTRIKPILTPIAAASLVVVMILAIGVHVSKGDISGALPALVLGILAAFVAWGRFFKAPIFPR